MINISKQVNLSSNSAKISNYPSNSACYFELPNMLKKHSHVKYITLSVSHAEIPVSFYIINESNNKLVINLNGGGDVEYTLTTGNYNGNTFKLLLLSILGLGWNIVLSQSNGKYTLSHTTYDFIVNGYLSTCNILMGFQRNEYYNSTSLSLKLMNPCNFLGASRINIKSSTLQLDNIDSLSNGHSGNISSISVNAELYGIILYQNYTGFRNIIYNDFLNGIDINITDENNNLINFNGVDWFITLQIDEHIDSNDLAIETNLTNFLKQQT